MYLRHSFCFWHFCFSILNTLQIRFGTPVQIHFHFVVSQHRDPLVENKFEARTKELKIIFLRSGTKMPALESVDGVRNRKMWSVFSSIDHSRQKKTFHLLLLPTFKRICIAFTQFSPSPDTHSSLDRYTLWHLST